MSAELLKPSTADDGVTRLKLRLRQQRQARYYNIGARGRSALEEGDSLRIQPWQLGKKRMAAGFSEKTHG